MILPDAAASYSSLRPQPLLEYVPSVAFAQYKTRLLRDIIILMMMVVIEKA